MCVEGGFKLAPVLADVAFERSVVVMCGEMGVEVRVVIKSFEADATFKRLLICVCATMINYALIVFCFESAFFAFKFFVV